MVEQSEKPSEIPPGIIKNIPLERVTLAGQVQERWNQPLWPGKHKVPAIHDAVVHSYEANPDVRTYAEAEVGDPGTAPSHAPEVDKESREEDRWGCWPEAKDL